MAHRSRLWSNTRYVVWLVSDTAKQLSGGLATFALPLLALAVTGEPSQAGIIGAIGTAVALVASLYGGVLADRHDRARLMLLGAAVAVGLASGLTVLILTGALSFSVLLGVEVILAAQFGLFGVAGESMLKDIVPADVLGRAQAANQARDAILRLGATPLAGALLAVGAWLIGVGMLVAALVETAAAALLRRMRRIDATVGLAAPGDTAPVTDGGGGPDDQAAGRDALVRRSAIAELREGVSWLMRRQDLRPVLFVMTLVNLGFNAAVTTIIFTLQQRGESPAVIGLLGSAIGAATLVGALAATPLVSRARAGTISIGALAVTAGAIGILPFTDAAPVMIAAPAAAMLLTPALNAALLGYSMVAIPTRLVGRVRSAMTVIVSGAMPLAPLLAGVGLSTIGASATFGIAAGCCGATALLACCTRALRSLPAEAGWEKHAAQFETSCETSPASAQPSMSG